MKNDHVGALLEDVQDKLTRLAEAIENMRVTLRELDIRLDRIEQQTEILPAVQAAVTDQTRELRELERRVSNLEVAA